MPTGRDGVRFRGKTGSPRRRAKVTRLTLNGLGAASILLDPKVVRFRTIDGPYWSFPDVLSSAEVVDPCRCKMDRGQWISHGLSRSWSWPATCPGSWIVL